MSTEPDCARLSLSKNLRKERFSIERNNISTELLQHFLLRTLPASLIHSWTCDDILQLFFTLFQAPAVNSCNVRGLIMLPFAMRVVTRISISVASLESMKKEFRQHNKPSCRQQYYGSLTRRQRTQSRRTVPSVAIFRPAGRSTCYDFPSTFSSRLFMSQKINFPHNEYCRSPLSWFNPHRICKQRNLLSKWWTSRSRKLLNLRIANNGRSTHPMNNSGWM